MRSGLATLLLTATASVSLFGILATAAIANVPRHYYGVVSTLSTGRDAARMGKAGVGSLRTSFYWPAIQPARRGPFNWSGIDTQVALAASERITVLPILNGTPAYEAHGCSTVRCHRHIELSSKGRRRDWRTFVRAAVERYGRHGSFWRQRPDLPPMPIGHWQLWNEENNPKQHNSPGRYAKLLALTDRAISPVDRHAKIVLGGMAGVTHGGKNTTAWHYLARLYNHHVRKHVGAVALHPYAPKISGLRHQLHHVRKVLRAKHAASTRTLITEIGWGSGGTKHHGGTGSRGRAFVVSPKEQRRKLARSFRLLTHKRRTWRIGGVYWYRWKDPKDPPSGLCAFCYSSGLYRADGTTAKPALRAYRHFARKAR